MANRLKVGNARGNFVRGQPAISDPEHLPAYIEQTALALAIDAGYGGHFVYGKELRVEV